MPTSLLKTTLPAGRPLSLSQASRTKLPRSSIEGTRRMRAGAMGEGAVRVAAHRAPPSLRVKEPMRSMQDGTAARRPPGTTSHRAVAWQRGVR